MNDLLKTYTFPLLRNFQVEELVTILPVIIPDFVKKVRAIKEPLTGWQKIAHVLDENAKENPELDKEIDEMFFERIFFHNQDHVHLFHLESEINAHEFMNRFQNSPELNRTLNTTVHSESNIITIRNEENKVFILYKLETVKLGRIQQHKSNFYVPCILDFENGHLEIRLRKNYIPVSRYKHGEILKLVREYINKLDNRISSQTYNETFINTLIYNLFKEESSKAESIIKEHMSENLTEESLNKKILTFLKEELEMSEPELYSERVKSAFYQDLSLHLDPKIFYNGFISAFVFLDKNLIRSSTRNPKRDPIYNSKVYWNLKDLIHEYKEVSELACFWKFNEKDFATPDVGENFEFVEISLKERNGSIEIHYYNNPSQNRRLKENYVYYRINKYL